MDFSEQDNKKKKRKYKTKKKKVANKIGLIIFRILIATFLIGIFAGGGAALGIYLAIIEQAPDLQVVKIQPDVFTSIIYEDSTGLEIDRFKGDENREYVKLEDISQNMKDAIVAIEDERFYSHNGIDIRGLMRIVYVMLTTGDRQGASTITQQVIKNNVTNVTKNDLKTKIQEQYLAVKYEKSLIEQLNGDKKAAKDYILELYLNTIALHHNLNGVQTASSYYFGKTAAELTIAESAVIAAITQIPSYYAPDDHPENNRIRQMWVLDKMLELGFVTQREYDDAVAEKVYDKIDSVSKIMEETPSIHSYYVDQVYSSVLSDLMTKKGYGRMEAINLIFNGGLKIYIPIDMEMQKIVDEAFLNDELFPSKDFELDVVYTLSIKNTVTEKMRNIEEKKTVKTMEDAEAFYATVEEEELGVNEIIFAERKQVIPQPQAAMAIIDYNNGYVKAIAGGRGEKKGDNLFNRATQATRSPGSVFKVLASFAPAIDLGRITPATVIDDVPYSYDDGSGKPYQPRNWNSRYQGLTPVRRGITNSMNILTVQNMYETGIDNCFNYLLNFGFTTLVESDRGLSTALGGLTKGVTQVEVAAAYGTMANGGEYNKPIFYTKVLDHNNETLLENVIEPRPVLKKTSAYLLTDMMKGVLTDPGATGGKARFDNVKMPIAGKTGTTTGTKDLTFVGYTPYYVASVWLGFDQQKPITQDSGYHLRLWSHIMERIHEDLPYKDFERPEGIVSVKVCKYSGKLPVSGLCDHDPRGSSLVTEIFAIDNQPTESCDVHVGVEYDTYTDMIVNPYCPEELRSMRIGIVRPDSAYNGKAEDSQYEIPSSLLSGDTCTLHGPFNSFVPEPEQEEGEQESEQENGQWPEGIPTPNPSESTIINENVQQTPPTVTPDSPASTSWPAQSIWQHLYPVVTPTPTPYVVPEYSPNPEVTQEAEIVNPVTPTQRPLIVDQPDTSPPSASPSTSY